MTDLEKAAREYMLKLQLVPGHDPAINHVEAAHHSGRREGRFEGFLAGAAYSQRWIPVSERLPDLDEDGFSKIVRGYFDDREYKPYQVDVFLMREDRGLCWYGSNTQIEELNDDGVITHWCDCIPAPPTSEKREGAC